jgi:uncharacterized repeat protein (TIGR01451 family)
VLTNIADITCDQGVSSATGPVTTTVWSTDLVITKTVMPITPLQPGDWLTYTLTFANQGHITATGVIITDTYQPVGLTNVISTSSGATVTPTAVTPPYTWEVEDLSSGEGGVITITAQVDPAQTWGWNTILTNTAYITTTQPDGDGMNNTDEVTSTIQMADAWVSKEIQPPIVISGDTITYTLIYTNAGAAVAQNVYLTDTLPSGVTYGGLVSENPDWPGSTPTYTVGPPQTVTWFTPTLAGGVSGTIVITATVDFTDAVSAIFTNTVQIATTTSESNTGNNIYQDSNRLYQPVDVAITKTVTPTASLQPGDWLTYTLTFSNQGYIIATGVVITDTYQPVGLTNVISTSSGAIVTPTSAMLPYTWEVEDLSPGEGGVITIIAQVDPDETWDLNTILTNTAYITATQLDGDGTNDVDGVSSTVLGTGNIYLPIVVKDWDGTIPPSPTGDLIVTSIAFDPSPPITGTVYSDPPKHRYIDSDHRLLGRPVSQS